jgi:DNA-directed RNA polymerase sigma subunit (sigma70/sigma32)
LHRWLQSRPVAPIGAQESLNSGDGDNPLDNVAGNNDADLAEDVAEALLRLPPLYRCVVRRRSGLAADPMSAEEVGQWLGLSPQRERSIYSKAYEAMKATV